MKERKESSDPDLENNYRLCVITISFKIRKNKPRLQFRHFADLASIFLEFFYVRIFFIITQNDSRGERKNFCPKKCFKNCEEPEWRGKDSFYLRNYSTLQRIHKDD